MMGCMIVLRLFIFFTYSTDVQIILTGLRKSIVKVVYIFMLFLLIIYAVSIPFFLIQNPIWGCQTDHLYRANSTALRPNSPVDPAFAYCSSGYGSLYLTFLTTFQVCTKVGWDNKLKNSIDYTKLSWVSPYLYIPMFLFGCFLFLNIFTGIVVGSVKESGKVIKEKEKKEKKEEKKKEKKSEESELLDNLLKEIKKSNDLVGQLQIRIGTLEETLAKK